VKLGVADLLNDGPRHADELVRATQTHAPSLRRVLPRLSSVGVFEERENGAFGLTSMGECLRAGVPGSARAMVMLFTGDRVQDACAISNTACETGNPVYRKRGLDDPFKDPARTPEDDANFDAAMADYTALISMAVAAVYDFAPLRTLVGCRRRKRRAPHRSVASAPPSTGRSLRSGAIRRARPEKRSPSID